MTDAELEILIQRRDRGDDEARDAIDAWVEQCLNPTWVEPSVQEKAPGDANPAE